jgi:hypothetical protein
VPSYQTEQKQVMFHEMDTAKLKLFRHIYIYQRKPERECSDKVTKPKIDLSMLHHQIFKRSNEPSHDKEYLLCKFSYTSEV